MYAWYRRTRIDYRDVVDTYVDPFKWNINFGRIVGLESIADNASLFYLLDPNKTRHNDI